VSKKEEDGKAVHSTMVVGQDLMAGEENPEKAQGGD
jgi:hypothetical protein